MLIESVNKLYDLDSRTINPEGEFRPKDGWKDSAKYGQFSDPKWNNQKWKPTGRDAEVLDESTVNTTSQWGLSMACRKLEHVARYFQVNPSDLKSSLRLVKKEKRKLEDKLGIKRFNPWKMTEEEIRKKEYIVEHFPGEKAWETCLVIDPSVQKNAYQKLAAKMKTYLQDPRSSSGINFQVDTVRGRKVIIQSGP